MRRSWPVVVAGTAVVAVVVAVVAFSLRRPKDVPRPTPSQTPSIVQSTPSVDLGLVDMQQAASLFNGTTLNPAHSLLVNFSSVMGVPRCWMGYAADFPGQVLITAIWPSGSWFQENIDLKTGIDTYSLKNGSSYQQAGIDPSSFDLAAYQCSVNRQGRVSVP